MRTAYEILKSTPRANIIWISCFDSPRTLGEISKAWKYKLSALYKGKIVEEMVKSGILKVVKKGKNKYYYTQTKWIPEVFYNDLQSFAHLGVDPKEVEGRLAKIKNKEKEIIEFYDSDVCRKVFFNLDIIRGLFSRDEFQNIIRRDSIGFNVSALLLHPLWRLSEVFVLINKFDKNYEKEFERLKEIIPKLAKHLSKIYNSNYKPSFIMWRGIKEDFKVLYKKKDWKICPEIEGFIKIGVIKPEKEIPVILRDISTSDFVILKDGRIVASRDFTIKYDFYKKLIEFFGRVPKEIHSLYDVLNAVKNIEFVQDELLIPKEFGSIRIKEFIKTKRFFVYPNLFETPLCPLIRNILRPDKIGETLPTWVDEKFLEKNKEERNKIKKILDELDFPLYIKSMLGEIEVTSKQLLNAILYSSTKKSLLNDLRMMGGKVYLLQDILPEYFFKFKKDKESELIKIKSKIELLIAEFNMIWEECTGKHLSL